jgi:hypothetical protein
MQTVILKRFDSQVEANIVKGLLESNDIFCFLQDEHSVSMNPLYSNALGGIKLNVRAEDAARAHNLLLANSTVHRMQCPQCGFHDVHYVTEKKNKMNWLLIFLSLIWTSPMHVKKKYECNTCNHVFESE